jgi:hypothetical protein
MEEAWANGKSWRWSAHLADYSQERVFADGSAYDAKSPGPIPLRLQMVRNAIFNAVPAFESQGLMRVASAKWEGVDLLCVLLSRPGNDPTPTPGRRWVETEHCVDPQTGLLHLWSEAPGIYVVYNYANSVHFHAKTVAAEISVVEGGTQVLDIRVQSLQDGSGDPAALKPTPQMLANGPGTLMTRVLRFPQTIVIPQSNMRAQFQSRSIQATSVTVPEAATPREATAESAVKVNVEPVIVHAIIDEHGKVIDAEALQNTNPTLSDAALNFVRKSTYPHQAPGTVPRQREAFINVRFVNFANGG